MIIKAARFFRLRLIRLRAARRPRPRPRTPLRRSGGCRSARARGGPGARPAAEGSAPTIPCRPRRRRPAAGSLLRSRAGVPPRAESHPLLQRLPLPVFQRRPLPPARLRGWRPPPACRRQPLFKREKREIGGRNGPRAAVRPAIKRSQSRRRVAAPRAAAGSRRAAAAAAAAQSFRRRCGRPETRPGRPARRRGHTRGRQRIPAEPRCGVPLQLGRPERAAGGARPPRRGRRR
jgi:hypothetical protein